LNNYFKNDKSSFHFFKNERDIKKYTNEYIMIIQVTFGIIWFMLLSYIYFSSNSPRTSILKSKRSRRPKKSVKKHINSTTLYEMGVSLGTNTNNIITRQQQKTCHDLYEFDQSTPLNTVGISVPKGKYFTCYGCNDIVRHSHPVYLFSCKKCGNIFQTFRHLSRNLDGYVTLVTGCRTKLGHQISLKLLRAGATVIGTTRFPEKAMPMFEKYSDHDMWKDRLHIYSIDFDNVDIQLQMQLLYEYVVKYEKLDVLVNCAAQTIRVREKTISVETVDKNRYNDAQFVKEEYVNSWQMMIGDFVQKEMEEVYRVNAIAPCLLVQTMMPLLKNSESPYIINVHAREGLIDVRKSKKHIHLNMAKSGLSMLTRCLVDCNLKTNSGKSFSIHGCDPGWLSIDEYYESDKPWIVPPLDEIDGAARILFPLFKKLKSLRKTRRHFYYFTF